MDVISNYINAITLIYNQPDSFTSVVDKKDKVLYLSKAMCELVSGSAENIPCSLGGYNQISAQSIEEIRQINHRVIETGQAMKYIYIGESVSGDFSLFRGTKYPIYDAPANPAAVFTIQYRLKSINVNAQIGDGESYCSEIPNHELSQVEQLIVFYASLGFSHGEAYQFIVKFTDSKLKFENFKYYGKQLLKKFGVTHMKELVDSVEVLKECRFIPRKLLKASVFLIKN